MVNSFSSYFTARSLFFSELLFNNRIIFFFTYQSLRYDDLFELRKDVLEQGWTISLVQRDIFVYEPLVHLSSVFSKCTAVLYSNHFLSGDKILLEEVFSFFSSTGFFLTHIKLDHYVFDLTQFEVYIKKAVDEIMKDMFEIIVNFFREIISGLINILGNFMVILSDLTFSLGYLVNLNANIQSIN